GVNYFQPMASYEVLKKADTSLFVKSDNENGNKCNNNTTVLDNAKDKENLEQIVLDNKLYSMLVGMTTTSPELSSSVQFVMLLNEMYRINRSLDLISRQIKNQYGSEVSMDR
ncbi:MAG TPA: hypothetical protein VHD33_02270, partial [Legionellaceae bacterium]|nr:hypothetical protein [Legionellaceae bacterium]